MEENILTNSVKKYISRDNIYKYFEDYGYKEEQIDIAISKLNEKQKKALHNYYGEDLHNPVINESLTVEEKKYVTESMILCLKRKLNKLYSKEDNKVIKKHISKDSIYKYFEGYGYEGTQVDVAISKLNGKQKKALHNYYGEDLHNPVINENITVEEKEYVTGTVFVCVKNNLNKLYSKEGNKVTKKYISRDNIYKYFEEYGYEENQVDVAISKLNEKQKKALHNYYGENLHNPVINESLTVEEKNYVTLSMILCLKRKLNKMYPKDGSKVKPTEKRVSSANIYKYFKEYGYEETQVDKVIAMLTDTQREALYNYYGKDLHNPVINENITVKEKNYVTKVLIKTIKGYLNNGIDEIETIKKNISKNNIYKYFREYGYEEEQVDKAISMLIEKQRKALYNYYGEDLHNPVINENLTAEDKDYILRTVIRTIKKKLNVNSGKIDKCIGKHVSRSNIYKYFKAYGYEEEQVDSVISKLTEGQRKALYNYYGEDLHNPVINENITAENEKYVLQTIVIIIKRRLDKMASNNGNISINKHFHQQVSKRNIYEYFKSYGYEEEQVDKTILELTEKQRKALYNYYGEALHNPVINENLTAEDRNYILGTVINTIKKKLDINSGKINVDKRISKSNIYEYFKLYGYEKEQVDKAILELIEKQRKALYNYYGEDLHNPEINENLSDEDKNYILNTVIKTIKKKLDVNSGKINVGKYISKANIYEYFKEYGYEEEQVDKTILELTEKQRKALYNYYGEALHNPVINENLTAEDRNYILGTVINTIKKKLDINSGKINKCDGKRISKRNIYEYFRAYGYEEEQVDKAILELTEGQRKALYNYYGEDLHNPKINKSLSDKEKNRATKTMFRIIRDHLDDLYNKNGDGVKKQKQVSRKNIYEYFRAYGYEEEQVDKAILELIEKQRKALYNYYGEDLHNPVINENLTSEDKDYILRTVIRTIKKKLNVNSGKIDKCIGKHVSRSNIYKYYKAYGYEEEQVDKAISMLEERQKEALYNYYGEDLHNPKTDKNTSSEDKLYIKNSVFRSVKTNLSKLFPKGSNLTNLDERNGQPDDVPVDVVNNHIPDNTEVISDEETFGNETNVARDEQDLEQIPIYYKNLVEELCKNNIPSVLSFMDKYLKLNQKGNYFELLIDLMKISIIEGDNDYFRVTTLLANIKNVDLYDLLASNIQSFYVALSCSDLELTELYLDVIILLDKLGACCVLKDNFEKIYKLSRSISKHDIKTDRLSEFDMALSSYKNIEVVSPLKEDSSEPPRVRRINL